MNKNFIGMDEQLAKEAAEKKAAEEAEEAKKPKAPKAPPVPTDLHVKKSDAKSHHKP